jgi:serine/threonine protein kinase
MLLYGAKTIKVDLEHYQVLDFCSGGSFLNFLNTRQNRFTEKEAKFYFCELLLALEHLHLKAKIAHNDLSP